MKNYLSLLFVFAALFLARGADAHCQVPCGIYDDAARIQSLLEDARTVAKACVMIDELAGKTDAQSQQQLVRWVTNKETHAEKVIRTVCDYYLTQRVKPSQEDYVERLKAHHAVILAAMKAKQHADEASAAALTEAIEGLLVFYPGE